VDIVSDKTIDVSVLNMLVLTFTNAAAEEMQGRIAEQLKAEFLKKREPRLYYQLLLLGGADISTIHSFCKRLITEHFYKLGLDPTFAVIEEDEQNLIKAEVLERTIDWAWEQGHLRQGLEQLFYRRELRTNDGFLSKIVSLSNFLDGLAYREKWCRRAILLAESANPFDSQLGEKQKQIVGRKLQYIIDQIRYAQGLYERENAGGNWSAKWEETFVGPVAECLEFLKSGDWDKCAEGIRNFQKPLRYEFKPRDVDGAVAEVIKSTARSAAMSFGKLLEFAVLNPDYLDKVGVAAGLQTKVLVELVRKFDQLYSQAKRAINCLDFADLEHRALELLTSEDSSEDNLVPSETALALRRRYRYILVDEYQDINPVQKAILELVSSEGNVFVVGDVKQSIYAFRGAEPKIFAEDLKSALPNPKDGSAGLRVDLNTNWRSNKGILDFVNKMFGRIMTASFADIDYDESAKLAPAVKSKSEKAMGKEGPSAELVILDETSGETDAEREEEDGASEDENLSWGGVDVGPRRRQAAMIAERIRQMVGADTGKAEFQIYDKAQDEMRDVEYRDIVILMRSPYERVNDYVEVLRLAGVPVSCEYATGYFEATEISDVVSLLKVLDNCQRDIELAAVLRSPFFGVSDTELAQIKIHNNSGKDDKNFYQCVLQYSAEGEEAKLAGRLKEILALVEEWQGVARSGNIADLIWRIYRQRGYLSFVSALANGRQRRANLLKLHERAIQFEGFASSRGSASLRRFVEFIEKLQETGQDWAGAEPEAEAENAVCIMSVHKSKGLEFPVVFVAELNSQFNKRDIQDDVLADGSDTLGLQIIDRQSNEKLSSLAHQIIAEEKLLTNLAEEMRILYVATTRARERLILTACEKRKHCEAIIRKGFFFGDGPIADWQLRSCKGHLEWILYALSDQKNLHNVFGTGLAGQGADEDLFSVKFYGQEELKEFSRYIEELKKDKSSRPKSAVKNSKSNSEGKKLLREVKESLVWRYRFADLAGLPAKRSVTQLTHRGDEYLRVDYSRALERRPRAVLSGESCLAEVPDGRQVGTATHLVIGQLDVTKSISKEAVEKTKEKLVADGTITEAVAKCIDTGSIAGFFESELGRAVLDGNNIIWREWPFSFAVPVSAVRDLWPVSRDSKVKEQKSGHERRATSDEIIVIQGIIDMVVETPAGLLIIDFKTDDIAAGQVASRAEFYREQLELYSRAAGEILKKKIAGSWLYFLTPGCAITM
jgi:ATP-dependent helicase/nuclease subunit A